MIKGITKNTKYDDHYQKMTYTPQRLPCALMEYTYRLYSHYEAN